MWDEEGLHGGDKVEPTLEGRAGFLKIRMEYMRLTHSVRNNNVRMSASLPKNEDKDFCLF